MTNEIQYLSTSEKAALVEIKKRIGSLFPIREVVLFGSKARGDFAEDSDIDILIVSQQKLIRHQKHLISHEITKVNREFSTLFSFIVIDEQEWNSEIFSYFPIKKNIEREGVLV